MTVAPELFEPLLPAAVREGRDGARDRIMFAAYELFSTRGIRDVGTNELIERSRVAKATFYRHFPSKDDLVLEFLQLRQTAWTSDQILADASSRGATAEERLLAIFDVLTDWFHRPDFEACPFVSILLEMGAGHPIGIACIGYLSEVRGHVRAMAEEAGLIRPEDFSRSWHILMKGAIVAASEGDLEAASRSQQMGQLLLGLHRS
ncbi:TetR/AcrR family transcriptional regulator [Pseudarthrobacter sp. PS3-L1]|uniref:TetR/AcrR family transcriptional regulator n=1 Tax=Pseudarthrobacter sp. PS3-L1 TaxID=3046207 RepID=UPI0024BB4207|nr:TetR/AcrR family transcriptional regulator [Pseudarthrobacter sp. PS3-L1]MDJ0320762.1 helix-turn-helix domain-containing protein [Pseudarthrobacter sp. PS3-L1]